MRVIGIDPGYHGAIAILNNKYEIYDMPLIKKDKKNQIDIDALVNIFSKFTKEDKIFIERVHAFPGQGVVSMFNFGFQFGGLVFLCAAFRLSYYLIEPRIWKSFYKIKEKEVYTKAKKIYPEGEFKTKRGKILDGRCEAVLLANYGKQLILKGEIK